VVGAVVALAIALPVRADDGAPGGPAVTPQQKLNISFEDATIGEVLKVLSQAGKFNYSLPPEFEKMTVTVSLSDVTPEQALQIVLEQKGLMAVNDNGVWVVRRKPAGRGASAPRATPAVPTGTAAVRQPPSATAAAPSRATTREGEATEAGLRREGEITRVLRLRHTDPGLIAILSAMSSGGMLVIVPSIFATFFWKRATAPAALLGMVVGVVIVGLGYVLGVSPLGVPSTIWGLIASTVILCLGSYVTKPPARAEEFLKRVSEELKKHGFH